MHKIIDAHAHLGYWPTLAKAKEMLIYSTNKNKVNFTLFSFDGTEVSGEHTNKIVPQIEASKKALSFVKKYPDRFGMLIRCRPRFEKNIQELDTFISKHREFIYGLKFHPYTSQLKITDPRNYPYFYLIVYVVSLQNPFSPPAVLHLLPICLPADCRANAMYRAKPPSGVQGCVSFYQENK